MSQVEVLHFKHGRRLVAHHPIGRFGPDQMSISLNLDHDQSKPFEERAKELGGDRRGLAMAAVTICWLGLLIIFNVRLQLLSVKIANCIGVWADALSHTTRSSRIALAGHRKDR
ncbi:hypothetical protein LOC70_12350 [Rhodopirellula sp. JC737]|nr:hypothetical protein [Rhodopirellula sp. JC737]